VYTDWTAIALLLFTAVPLVVVVGTATFFVVRNKQKAPLGGTRLWSGLLTDQTTQRRHGHVRR